MSRENLRTAFKTDMKSEPEGVRNEKNQLKTGAGEIAWVKITPIFETLLNGPAKLMSEWMDPSPGRATGRRKSSQPGASTSFGPIP
jgi:hypothetical protein